MKKIVGLSLAFVSVISITIPSSTFAANHYDTFGGKLTGGVGNWGSPHNIIGLIVQLLENPLELIVL